MNKRDLVLTIIIGIFIGTLFCVLNILISLKTGLGFGGEQIVAVSGFIILTAIKKNSILNVNIIQSTACGAFLATFAVDSAIAACAIYHKSMLSLESLIVLGVVTLVIGFMGAYFISGYFIEQKKLTYPIGKATAETILSLTSEKGKVKFLCMGVLVSLLINIPIYVIEIMPDTVQFSGLHTPSFIGIAISPMLFGLGFLIGSRTSISMTFGAILSIILWVVTEGAKSQITYNRHLESKWIMSLSISIMILSSFIPLFNKSMLSKIVHIGKKREKGNRTTDRQQNKLIWGTCMIVIVLMLGVFLLITKSIHDAVIISLVLLPVLCFGIVFCCNSVGETGLSPITPLGIISFIVLSIFLKDFREIIFGGAFVCAVTSAAVTMINSLKTAQILESDSKIIMFVTTIGGIFGVIVGAIVIIVMSNTIGYGTEKLPAPVSVTWGAIVDSLSKGMVPENINPLICMLGLLVGIALNSIGVSVICFGVGVMLSPSITATIFLGGFCRKAIEMLYKQETARKEEKLADGELVMSGLIIGEGVAIIIMMIKILICS